MGDTAVSVSKTSSMTGKMSQRKRLKLSTFTGQSTQGLVKSK